MLNETVKAPNFFTISIVTRKAKEVHTTAKNKSQKTSEILITNIDESILPEHNINIVRPTKPIANSYILI